MALFNHLDRPTDAPHAGARFEPIAGVSLDLFAEISRSLAVYGYDLAKGPELAASRGVSADEWIQATAGWNDRIKTNAAVAERFDVLYLGTL
jgi:hypothetical protein